MCAGGGVGVWVPLWKWEGSRDGKVLILFTWWTRLDAELGGTCHCLASSCPFLGPQAARLLTAW